MAVSQALIDKTRAEVARVRVCGSFLDPDADVTYIEASDTRYCALTHVLPTQFLVECEEVNGDGPLNYPLIVTQTRGERFDVAMTAPSAQGTDSDALFDALKVVWGASSRAEMIKRAALWLTALTSGDH